MKYFNILATWAVWLIFVLTALLITALATAIVSGSFGVVTSILDQILEKFGVAAHAPLQWMFWTFVPCSFIVCLRCVYELATDVWAKLWRFLSDQPVEPGAAAASGQPVP